MDEKTKKNESEHAEIVEAPFAVVGIGASAGGLQIINELLGGVGDQPSAAFVVAMHLSPHHESQLVDILKNVCDMPVQAAEHDTEIQPGMVYVTPPNVNLAFSERRFDLQPAAKGPYPKPSVDLLLKSMSEEFGEHAVGVILSGTGSDGAAGVRAIKQCGGVTIVQDPETAPYNGMPQSAIETGCVDLVAHRSKLADVISSVISAPLAELEPTAESTGIDVLSLIVNELKIGTQVDFAYIKPSTLLRRIGRRCALHGHEDLEAYLRRIKEDRDELVTLSESILISVTSFFRDAKVWRDVEKELRTVFEAKGPEEQVRVWVPACATGEEAFTIAMVCYDIMDSMERPPSLTIFASDMHEPSVSRARNGYYSRDAVAGLPPGKLDRYFTQEGDQLRLKGRIRQSVVFSVQNLMVDPPFSRIDFISCRNFLIYLRPEPQRLVLELFHYALVNDGLLLLGLTEAASVTRELYRTLSHEHRIYRRAKIPEEYRKQVRQRLEQPFRPRPTATAVEATVRKEASLSESAMIRICNELAPTWVIVDEHDIVKFCSPRARPYIEAPAGPMIMRVYDVLGKDLNLDLRGLMFRARRLGKVHYGKRTFVKRDEIRLSVAPILIPLTQEFPGYWAIVIDIAETRHEGGDGVGDEDAANFDQAYVKDLETRVDMMRQDLQSMTEELETSNEELQSQSEELQSSNEELQSMNEQLLTSNEELQSSNEELLTVNEEFRARSMRAAHESARWTALRDLLDECVLMFDDDQELETVTGRSELLALFFEKVNLVPGESIWKLPWKDCVGKAFDELRKAVKSEQRSVIELELEDGKAGRMQVRPVVLHEDKPDSESAGLVVLLDIVS